MGILVIMGSVLAGILQRGGTLQIAATVTTAVCGAIVSFVNPARQGAGYLKAWRHLDSAVRRYESAPDATKLERINDAIDEGELMIEESEALTTTEKARVASLAMARKQAKKAAHPKRQTPHD